MSIKEKLVGLFLGFQSQYRSLVPDKDGLADYLIANDVTIKTEPETIHDWICSMDEDTLGEFLDDLVYSGKGPWEALFDATFCQHCPTTTVTTGDGFQDDLHPCCFSGQGCPHGKEAVWWVRQKLNEVR